MSKLFIAFYYGPGKFHDRVVRFATRSKFSHCELVQAPATPNPGDSAPCLSSSGRDGGVREKIITFKPDRWTFVELPWAPANAWSVAQAELGKPYDYYAMIWTHLLNFRGEDREKWFCSELCAHALGMGMPNVYSPGDLYRALEDQGDVAGRALRDTGGRRKGSGKRGWL